MDIWKRTAARRKLRHGNIVRSEKIRSEKIRGGEDQRWRRSERETVRRKEMQEREKVRKSRNTVFSNVLWLRKVEK